MIDLRDRPFPEQTRVRHNVWGEGLVLRHEADSIVGRAFTIFWPVSRATWLSVPKEFDSIPDAAPAN